MHGSWVEKKRGWLKEHVPKKKKKEERPVLKENFEEAVIFVRPRCPKEKCRSTDLKWYGSDGEIRYYKCNKCGVKFKAFEKKVE